MQTLAKLKEEGAARIDIYCPTVANASLVLQFVGLVGVPTGSYFDERQASPGGIHPLLTNHTLQQAA